MPRGDGTGPAGQGAMTGRAAGYCAGFNVPGYMNRGPGRGGAWGRGPGRGRRFGRAYYASPAPQAGPGAYAQGGYTPQQPANSEAAKKQELQYLQNTEQAIQEELEAVKNRIEEIENELE